MDTRIVVDASVLVSQLMPLDTNHKTSLFWLNQFSAAGGLLVAPVFLQIEVAAAVSRRTGQPELSKNALENLNSTSAIQFVSLDSALVQAAINIATDLQLRAGDAIYVAVAHQMHIPLISWDNEQLQRAGSLIPTYTPDAYPFEAAQP